MFGLDCLGLGSKYWKVRDLVELWPNDWALGVFGDGWRNAFGDPLPKVRKILQTGRCPVVRIQMYWDKDHKLVPLSFIKKWAPKYHKFASQFPPVKFYLSPSCEYKSKDRKALKDIIDCLMDLAPDCSPILNPLDTKQQTLDLFPTEYHGNIKVKSSQVVSLDGTEGADIDIEKWKTLNGDALICFLWSHRFNLRQEGRFIEPNERTAAPDRRYISNVIDWGDRESINGSLERGWLYKTMAEDKLNNNDPRANKPLIIGPVKTDFLEVKKSLVNFRIARFKFYGPYSGGGYRYYIEQNLTGYELCLKSGSDNLVRIVENNRDVGIVDPNRRVGYFRG